MKQSILSHVLAALLFALALPVIVSAGTPLICHPYDIGPAKSLPVSASKGADPAYDRTRLVRDTLALLTPDTPVLVRMETLRRAAIHATADMRGWAKDSRYTEADRGIALALLESLRARATESSTPNHDLACFDLGFYAETLRHARLDPAFDGYGLLLEVAAARPADADIQFALALASSYPDRKPDHARHLEQALNGARPGSLLAANLRTHFSR